MSSKVRVIKCRQRPPPFVSDTPLLSWRSLAPSNWTLTRVSRNIRHFEHVGIVACHDLIRNLMNFRRAESFKDLASENLEDSRFFCHPLPQRSELIQRDGYNFLQCKFIVD